jgi:hypothetical protein
MWLILPPPGFQLLNGGLASAAPAAAQSVAVGPKASFRDSAAIGRFEEADIGIHAVDLIAKPCRVFCHHATEILLLMLNGFCFLSYRDRSA